MASWVGGCPGSLVNSVVGTFNGCTSQPTFIVRSATYACKRLTAYMRGVSSLFGSERSGVVNVITRGELRACTSVLSTLVYKGACIVLRPSCPGREGSEVTSSTNVHLILRARGVRILGLSAQGLRLVYASRVRRTRGSTAFRTTRSVLRATRRRGTCVVFASKDANRPGKMPVSHHGLGTFCATCRHLS